MTNKYKTKSNGIFTINTDVLSNFKKVAKRMSINKSALVETFLKEWTERNKDKISSTVQ
jgi:hypothetical protein